MVSSEKDYLKCKGDRATKTRFYHMYRNAQKIFDKKLRSASRLYNRNLVSEIECLSTENHKDFWDKLKRLGPRQDREIPIKVKKGNEYVSNLDDVLETWKNDFEGLLNAGTVDENCDEVFYEQVLQHKQVFEQNMEAGPDPENVFLNFPISMVEIEKSANKLKNKKAKGEDMIPNEVLKCRSLHVLLQRLFNKCFACGMVPSIWKKALIKPIPKNSTADPYVPINYRGISLISCVSKMYSGILNCRIVAYCNSLGLFPDEQNGFRQGRSCEDHIFTLSSIIKSRLSMKQSTFCAFIDLEKAFDWVNRDMLMYKMLQNNIDGKMYWAVNSLLSNTFSCVQLTSDLKTEYFNVSSGVRQGDPLSPTLFSLYINDLTCELKQAGPMMQLGNVNLNILLYADDMVLLAENEDNLQALLNILHNWCSKWRLRVNIAKTKIVHFRPRTKQITSHNFYYGPKEIEKVQSYKYLGITLDEFLKFDRCAASLASSGGRALGGIISKFKSLKNVGYDTYTKLFNAGVRPILEYGSGIWGYVKSKEIDIVYSRAMRYYLGVHRFTPTAGIYGDMGWLRPHFHRYISILRFWNRCINMGDDRLTKKIFLWDLDRKKGWGEEIKSIFISLDLQDKFENIECCDLDFVNERIKTLAEHSWKTDIQSKPKLRTYTQFKNKYETELYVNRLQNRRKRSLFAQFRLGVLPLRIETGRFRNLPCEQRICQTCDMNKVEDEFHFIMECTIYQDLRNVLFFQAQRLNSEFNDLSDIPKFLFLVSLWRETACYIESAWKQRQDIIYV